jgi:YidC/Oxa1 family membrane protein insertase
VIAEIPVVSPVFQGLLNSVGWVLAHVYDVVPNYGIAIIVLTLLIRVALLPLFLKQMKSTQAMQAIQPKIKEIQKKYKGNRQKSQEETMKLYQESGVNPLASCLPLLLQFPVLIAIYSVIRPPQYLPVDAELRPVTEQTQIVSYEVVNNHIPEDSGLFRAVVTHESTSLVVNLQCGLLQAGTPARVNDTTRKPVIEGKPLLRTDTGEPIDSLTAEPNLHCGSSWPAKIPYGLLLVIMVGTTFYQQRQMQQMSPPGATSQQQQTLMKVMPLMFAVFGLQFPAGLVLYWTFSNTVQILQQHFLMRAGHIGPAAVERRIVEQQAKAAATQGEDRPTPRRGLIGRMMERADQERRRREQELIRRETTQRKPGVSKGSGGGTGSKEGSKEGSKDGRTGGSRRPQQGRRKKRRR